MAAILHREVIGPIHYLRVDADPALAGTAAPIGSIAILDTGMAWYLKQGAGDGDWTWSDAGASAAGIATNLAHTTADGSSHADVATNSAHSAGDGSDHADVATNTAAIAALPTNPIVDHDPLAADSLLTGAGMGAATETAHTAQQATSADVNTARRTLRWRGRLYANSNNAADNWRSRWRVGGVAGALVLDTGAWALLAGEWVDFDVEIQIRSVGAGGTFDSVAKATKHGGGGGPVEYESQTLGGAIDTTGAVDFAVTGWSSSNNASQSVTLRDAELEVWA